MARLALCAALSLFAPLAAVAETRWAVIVSGASGGEKYAEQMKQWRDDAAIGAGRSSRVRAPTHVRMLVDETVTAGDNGLGRERAARSSARSRRPAAKDDFVLVVLLGHGTYDGDVAKFNLVGPDLTATDWTSCWPGVPGRLVVVNTTEASFPFLESLTAQGPGRDHRHRLGGAEVRHRVSRVLRQGAQRGLDRPRQERPHVDLRGVRGGQRWP